MNENIVLFLKKVNDDAALQEQFKTITDPDAAYALASSIQPGFTKEEFVEAMTKIKAQLEAGEVSDDDLKKTAGGSLGDLLDPNKPDELTAENVAIMAGTGAVLGLFTGGVYALCSVAVASASV